MTRATPRPPVRPVNHVLVVTVLVTRLLRRGKQDLDGARSRSRTVRWIRRRWWSPDMAPWTTRVRIPNRTRQVVAQALTVPVHGLAHVA